MKLKLTNNPNIHSDGINKSSEFDIELSNVEHIIHVVTNQYTNQELAFIRETCSNAYDAHIEAGNIDQQFDFHLPSFDEPWIEIRDYGTGLSDDFMLNSYNKLFLSTKTLSNNVSGGFGLGRLVFQLLTDQVMITSYQDGIKYVYNCTKNEKGILTINKFSESPTDEPNGLKLKFNIDENRISTFNENIREYFSIITDCLLPNFINDPNSYIQESIEEDRQEKKDCKLRGDNWLYESNSSNSHVIMGSAYYPIAYKDVRSDNRFYNYQMFFNGFTYMVNIGDMRPLPNREALEFNMDTKQSLINIFDGIINEVITNYDKEMGEAEFLYQAIEVYNKFKKFSDFINFKDEKYKFSKSELSRSEVVVSSSYTLEKGTNIIGPEIESNMRHNYDFKLDKVAYGQKVRYEKSIGVSSKHFLRTIYVLNDVGVSDNYAKRIILNIKDGYNCNVIMIKPLKSNVDRNFIVNNLLQHGVYDAQIMNLSQFERPKRKGGHASAFKGASFYRISSFTRSLEISRTRYSSYSGDALIELLDMDNVVYTISMRGTFTGDKEIAGNFMLLGRFNMNDSDKVFIEVPKSLSKKLPEQWMPLEVYIESKSDDLKLCRQWFSEARKRITVKKKIKELIREMPSYGSELKDSFNIFGLSHKYIEDIKNTYYGSRDMYNCEIINCDTIGYLTGINFHDIVPHNRAYRVINKVINSEIYKAVDSNIDLDKLMSELNRKEK